MSESEMKTYESAAAFEAAVKTACRGVRGFNKLVALAKWHEDSGDDMMWRGILCKAYAVECGTTYRKEMRDGLSEAVENWYSLAPSADAWAFHFESTPVMHLCDLYSVSVPETTIEAALRV